MCAAACLYHVATRPDNRRWVAAYIVLLVVATLFRPNWMMWSVALIPLARSRKQLACYGAVFFLGPLVSYASIKLFCAPFSLTDFSLSGPIDDQKQPS